MLFHYTYDGVHAWADFDELGNATVRYLFGDGTDEILARFRTGDDTAWYLTDTWAPSATSSTRRAS